MKRIVLSMTFGILLIPFFLNAQINSKIEEPIATLRMSVFSSFKQTIFTATGIKANNLPIRTQNFIDLLSRFHDTSSYNGVRVYFAVTDDNSLLVNTDQNRLTLLFVPTRKKGLKNENDSSNVYALLSDTFYHTNFNRLTIKWINTYNNFTPRIERVLSRLSTPIIYTEDSSLWYSDSILFRRPTSADPDILTFLQTTQINNIAINFASWSFEPFPPDCSFKMDLIFAIEFETKDNLFFSCNLYDAAFNIFLRRQKDLKEKLTTEEKVRRIERIAKVLQNTYGDTGLPCPPYNCP